MSIQRVLSGVVLTLWLASGAWAQGFDYHLAAGVRHTVLPNGLVVLVKPVPHATSVAIDLLTRVGPSQEDNTTSGMATLIGHLLEARISHPGDKPDPLMDKTGTVTNVQVTLDFTELSVVTGPDSANAVLKRVLQAYGKRPFDHAEIDEERTKLVKSLEGGEGDFASVYDLFREVFYRYHPYRAPLGGDAEAVRKFTDATVNQFISRWYVPNRTVISVVGDVDLDLASLVQASPVGSLAAVPEPDELITWEPVSTEKEVELVSLQRMAFLFLGYPAPSVNSSDYPAMQVLNSILGTGVSSRMWMDLREERGLAYELGSQYPTLEGPSHLLSFVLTRPNQVRTSRHRLFVVMDRMRREEVPDWELDYARWKTVAQVLSSIETPQGQASQLASTEAQGVGYQFTDQYLAAIWKVSAADVKRVANRYLDNYTLLVARPEGTEPLLPDHL